MKVLLLNGPPSSGKDTLGRLICNRLQSPSDIYYGTYKMSQPLKDSIPAAFDVSFDDLESKYKDTPCPYLLGKTFREMQISMSEDWLKVIFGQDVFGQIAVHRIAQLGMARAVIVTDAGFTDEARPIVEHFGRNNVSCVRLNRPGCDFSNDSRDWLDIATLGITGVTIYNEGHDEEALLSNFVDMNDAMKLL